MLITIITNDLVSHIIIIVIVLPLIGFSFWILLKPWFKLSQTYKTDLSLEDINILLEYQNCILDKTRINSRLNIGITKKGLYLSLTSPIHYLISPLLINWNMITKIEPYFDSVWGSCYKFSLGSPTITTIILT